MLSFKITWVTLTHRLNKQQNNTHQEPQMTFTTTIEKNVANEINMLKDIIAMTKADIGDMVAFGDYEDEDMASAKANLVQYEAELAAYN